MTTTSRSGNAAAADHALMSDGTNVTVFYFDLVRAVRYR